MRASTFLRRESVSFSTLGRLSASRFQASKKWAGEGLGVGATDKSDSSSLFSVLLCSALFWSVSFCVSSCFCNVSYRFLSLLARNFLTRSVDKSDTYWRLFQLLIDQSSPIKFLARNVSCKRSKYVSSQLKPKHNSSRDKSSVGPSHRMVRSQIRRNWKPSGIVLTFGSERNSEYRRNHKFGN